MVTRVRLSPRRYPSKASDGHSHTGAPALRAKADSFVTPGGNSVSYGDHVAGAAAVTRERQSRIVWADLSVEPPNKSCSLHTKPPLCMDESFGLNAFEQAASNASWRGVSPILRMARICRKHPAKILLVLFRVARKTRAVEQQVGRTPGYCREDRGPVYGEAMARPNPQALTMM